MNALVRLHTKWEHSELCSNCVLTVVIRECGQASHACIKDTAAGNILLSASILYSVVTTGKVLRLMNHMRVACISD